MTKYNISALIIAQNEELMIENCIKSLSWCDEVIVIDSGSTDKTREIAESFGAKVISFSHHSFSRLREEALKRASNDWVLYIDADERITPTLAKEIMVNIETGGDKVLRVSRENIYFGKKLNWGGWQNDKVERVFKKNILKGWSGDIHESPNFQGEIFDLKTKLLHFTHRDIISGLIKTTNWTPIEANELFKSDIHKVTSLTLIRKGAMEFCRRYFFNKGYKDGMVGFIEAIIQGFNRIVVYIQVWELQQNPSISKRYNDEEEIIKKLWLNEKNVESKK